jgi:hypothetical protein
MMSGITKREKFFSLMDHNISGMEKKLFSLIDLNMSGMEKNLSMVIKEKKKLKFHS